MTVHSFMVHAMETPTKKRERRATMAAHSFMVRAMETPTKKRERLKQWPLTVSWSVLWRHPPKNVNALLQWPLTVSWSMLWRHQVKLWAVYTVHLNNIECFFLRLLLNTVRGLTSFQDLRTVDRTICSMYRLAY